MENKITPECLLLNLKKLQIAFPDITADFVLLLEERLTVNNFNDHQLNFAVGMTLDKCDKKYLTIADIIKNKPSSMPTGQTL